MPTERPIALGSTSEAVEAVVPRLEKERASRDDFLIDNVTVYSEYPKGDPMKVVAEMCDRLNISTDKIAVDSDGSSARNGYTGPALSELISADISVENYVTDMREVKGEYEIELIREASTWANLGHRLLQERIEPGRRPIEVRAEVEAESVKMMLDTLGDRYEMRTWANPMQCPFTTGDVTLLPHSMDQTTRIEHGDNIISIVKLNVGGYTTELERTMFVGELSDDQRTYFEILKESQDIAIEMIEPGVEYSTIEEAVIEYYEEQGVSEYSQHHIGHNIGMEGHERPFLDIDYEGEIRHGELFTVEPGFYIPDLGGFRHSDTVLVTEDGTKTLTYYLKRARGTSYIIFSSLISHL